MRFLKRMLLGLCMALSVVSGGCAAQTPVEDVVRRVEPTVLRVYAKRGDKWPEGSGVIIDGRARLAVTNCHVACDASVITVEDSKGRRYHASVLARDEASDVALLRLAPPTNWRLRSARMAYRDPVKGSAVLAVGSPFSMGISFTQGIVSGHDRAPSRMLQSDAATNPGNSGGGLFNMRGELVGINTRIVGAALPVPQFAGITLSIPVSQLRYVVSELRARGFVRRPNPGFEVEVEQREPTSINLPPIRVTAVEANRIGARLGLQVGDVITHVNGERITSLYALQQIVVFHPADKTITVDVYRGASHLKLSTIYRD